MLPITVETERTTLLTALTRAQIAYDEVQMKRLQRRADYQRQEVLAPLQWEHLRLTLLSQIATAQQELDDARDQAANRDRGRQLDEQAHQLTMLRKRIEHVGAEDELRQNIAAMRQAKVATPTDNTPEEFRRNWRTERRVRANRSEAELRIDAIYTQARAERRNLTPEEIEEVDALADAGEAAEADVGRRAASALG
jgi:hypothetical protein